MKAINVKKVMVVMVALLAGFAMADDPVLGQVSTAQTNELLYIAAGGGLMVAVAVAGVGYKIVSRWISSSARAAS